MLRLPTVDLQPLADAIRYAADMGMWIAVVWAIVRIIDRPAR